MNDMIEVKTADLTGLALDYATGIADGRELELPGAVRGRTGLVWCDPFVIKHEGRPDFHDKTRRKWSPSTDWSQGGQLIQEHGKRIGLELRIAENSASFLQSGMRIGYTASHVLIAACRAIVATKLGAMVSVPKELVQ